MTVKCEIPLKLPSLNEYINECRKNKYAGGKIKKEVENDISIFIQRLQPVDPAVFVNEKSDRAIYLVVVLEGIYEIVFRQGLFQLVVQCVVGNVPDAENIHAVPVQAVAELCAGHGVSR